MGKSVFASELVHMYRDEKPGSLLGAVFFKFNDSASQDPILLLKSLVYQMARSFPAIVEDLLNVLRDHAEERTVEGVFETYLIAALELIEKFYDHRTRLLIFDALDESGSEGSKLRHELLLLFKRDFLKKLPGWVKMFVTGRPESDIEETLHACAHRIEEEDRRHLQDLRDYIDFSVRQVFQYVPEEGEVKFNDSEPSYQDSVMRDCDKNIKDEEAIQKAVDLIFKRSEGKFVYTAVVADQIDEWYGAGIEDDLPLEQLRESDESKNGGNHVRARSESFDLKTFKARLETLPVGLDDCYSKTFEKLHRSLPSSCGKSFLLLMVSCFQPLSEESVRFLLDMNGDEISYLQLVNSTRTVFPLNAARYFIPYHKTIVDWLLEERRSGRELCCRAEDGHLLIVEGLLRKCHITLKGHEGDINWLRHRGLQYSDVKNLQIELQIEKSKSSDTTLVYALRFLSHHLIESPHRLQLCFIAYFLLTNLTWIQLSVEFIDASTVSSLYSKLLLDRRWLPDTNQAEVVRDVKVMSQFFKFLLTSKVDHPSKYRSVICLLLGVRLRKARDRSKSERIDFLLKEAEAYLIAHGDWVPRQQPPEGLQTNPDGHSSSISSLCTLQDGRLVSGAGDDYVKIWDLSSSCCNHTITEHTSWVMSLCTLKDGRLVTGSWDETLKIWNINGWVCELTLVGHASDVRCHCALIDGRLASGSDDLTIKIWNLSSGQCELTMSGHRDAVVCISTLPDGRIVSGSRDKSIKVWNVETGSCDLTLLGHTNTIFSLCTLRDGRVASASRDKTIKIWSISGFFGKCDLTLTGHTLDVYVICELKDGRLASGSWDEWVRIWNTESGRCELCIHAHNAYVSALCALEDGNLASGSGDLCIKVWNTETGHCMQTICGNYD